MADKDEPKKAEAKVAKQEPDVSAGTPSGIALAEAGEPDEDATDEEKNEQAAAYQAAKLKARRG